MTLTPRNEQGEDVTMLESGLRLGEYEVVRYATHGGTSEVYEGRHTSSGRPVAVKVLDADMCIHADVIMRFVNEACTLEGLRHARLIAMFTQGRLSDERPYMVLEWLPHNLRQALERADNGVPSPVAASVGAQIAEALSALHERGIVHRDLKPANLLMAKEDLASADLKLADLGLAKLPHEAMADPEGTTSFAAFHVSTDGSDVLGTCEYMAPEQWIRSKNVDPKADVYSLGVLLFQMLTGRLPFVAEQRKEWMGCHLLESPAFDLLDGRASRTFRDLIRRMLSKKVGPRPTMREVMEKLEALRSGG